MLRSREARLSHLAYAPEIAWRHASSPASRSGRRSSVPDCDGAVGMVKQALDKLSVEGVVELGEEQKAAMVSNLMVVLCSEQSGLNFLNAGTLYG